MGLLASSGRSHLSESHVRLPGFFEPPSNACNRHAFPALVCVLLGWAGLGSGRRAIFHWHPAYRAGYARLTSEQAFELQDGEMLAACPNCLAVLAIQPTMLGKSDRCPHCTASLVNDQLFNRYSDEEE